MPAANRRKPLRGKRMRKGEKLPKIPEKSIKTPGMAVKTADGQVENKLRPFTFHKVELAVRGGEAVGECPFCARPGKLGILAETGQWRCVVCGEAGNALTFLRTLWDRSDAATSVEQLRPLALDRCLLDPMTLTAWGVCRSLVDGAWLIPGYDQHGKLHQLYRRTPMKHKDGTWVKTLLPTPDVWPAGKGHGLHMASMGFDPNKPNILVAEGPWDGMAVWEVMRGCKPGDGGHLELTGSEVHSLLADWNVVAVPGCCSFAREWLAMFKGKRAVLTFDSDHPNSTSGTCAGFEGVKRAAKLLSGVAKSVEYLKWGDGGFDPDRKGGFDVRDFLTAEVEVG